MSSKLKIITANESPLIWFNRSTYLFFFYFYLRKHCFTCPKLSNSWSFNILVSAFRHLLFMWNESPSRSMFLLSLVIRKYYRNKCAIDCDCGWLIFEIVHHGTKYLISHLKHLGWTTKISGGINQQVLHKNKKIKTIGAFKCLESIIIIFVLWSHDELFWYIVIIKWYFLLKVEAIVGMSNHLGPPYSM